MNLSQIWSKKMEGFREVLYLEDYYDQRTSSGKLESLLRLKNVLGNLKKNKKY